MMVLMPSVAKDKAPKSEKVNNIILLIGDGMGLGVAGAWMVDRNYEPTLTVPSSWVCRRPIH